MTEDLDQTAAAYHEAGHVLVAHLLGGEVAEVTLESERDDHVGHTSVVWRGFAVAEVARCSAMVALAGPAAETLWRGEDVVEGDLSGWRADQDEVDRALADLVAPEERDALRERLLFEVVSQLREPAAWAGLCCIADALEAHGTLDRSLLGDYLV